MEHTVTQYKDCVLVEVTGRVDSYTAPELGRLLKSLNDEGSYKIVLDMAGVNFLSSAGWWILINTQKRCKQNSRGEVIVANLEEKIRESMELVGIGHYFRIFGDITSALSAF